MRKTHKNKVLALLLSVVMVGVCMIAATTAVFAGGEMVAQIGEQGYETLADAVDNAQEESKIELLTDVDFGDFEGTALNIPAGKKLTLDLSGHTISGTATNAGTSQLINIAKGSEVTIIDTKSSGKITYKSSQPDPKWGYGTYTINNAGTLTVKSGRIENLTVNGASYAIENHANWQADDAIFNLEGGVITCPKGDQAVRLYSNWGGSMTAVGKSIMTMTGGTIEAGGIWCNDQVANGVGGFIELNISGGIVNGMLDFIGVKDQTVINITGGTFDTSSLRLRNSQSGDNTKPYINISDNAVIKLSDLDNQNTASATDNTMYISGGTFIFKDSVKNDLKEGFYDSKFEIVANNDKDYPWRLGTAVASIGETKYETLSEAVDAVTSSDTKNATIKILTDINYGEYSTASAVEIPAEDTVTLDLNGHTISGISTKGSSAQLLLNKGTLTMTDSTDNKDGRILCSANPTWNWDGSENYSGSYASNTITNHGTLVLEHGSIENTSSGSAVYGIDTYKGSVTINGGSVRVAKSNALRLFPNAPLNVEINGGTLYSNTYWPVQIHGGYGQAVDLTINGGQILTGGNSNKLALYVYAGGDLSKTKLTINGGTFNGDVTATAQLPTDNLKVTGGQFGGPYGIYSYSYEGNYISGGVYRGTYWSNFLEDGLDMVDNTDPETKDAYPYTVGKIARISVTSGLENDKTMSVATLSGGGNYAVGDIVKVVAPSVGGLDFVGWYDGDKPVSTDSMYIFEATTDINLIAIYKGKGQNVTIGASTDGGGSVTIDGTDAHSKSVAVGSTVKLTATPNEDYYFQYWANAYGKVVSAEADYEVKAFDSKEYKAVFSQASSTMVIFHDDNHNLLKAELHTDESAVTADSVVAPSKVGHRFDCWVDVNGEEVAIADAVKDKANGQVKLYAKYTQVGTYIATLKFADGNGTDVGVDPIVETRTIGTATIFSVPEINAGRAFQGFYTEAGDLLTTNTSYSVMPTSDVTVVARYAENEAVVEAQPTITLNDSYANYTNAEKLAFSMSWNLPAKYTVTETGFYRGMPGSNVDRKWVSGLTSNEGSATLFINLGGNVTSEYCVKAYVEYKDNQGNPYTLITGKAGVSHESNDDVYTSPCYNDLVKAGKVDATISKN